MFAYFLNLHDNHKRCTPVDTNHGRYNELYTNHRCPYAHRSHIALEELGLPFEETIIDLDTPRPQWYLDINPRGKPFHIISQ